MVFLSVTAAEVILTMQFMVRGPFPNVVVVAPETVISPFCTMPAVNCAVVPPAVRVNPPKSSIPLVIVIFVIPVLAFNRQVLLPATIVTLSAAPGLPLGVQLPGTFQAVDIIPFHVYAI